MEKMGEIYIVYQEDIDTILNAETFEDIESAEEMAQQAVDEDDLDLDDGDITICRLEPVRTSKPTLKFEDAD